MIEHRRIRFALLAGPPAAYPRERMRSGAEPCLGRSFGVPLPDGTFGLVWIVEVLEDCLKVAAADWVAADLTVRLPVRPGILQLTHPGCVEQAPCITLVPGPPPAGFVPLALLPLPRRGARLPSFENFKWTRFPEKILDEWMWRTDRPAYLAKYPHLRASVEQEARIATRRGELVLGQIDVESLLGDWGAADDPRYVAACKTALAEAIESLAARGSDATKKTKQNILRDLVRRLNRVSETHDIDTVDREVLLQAFGTIAVVAGFEEAERLADKWRDF